MPPITPPVEPPGMPPGTPPGTPPAPRSGGASSSLIIWTLLGILVGWRNSPLTISLCIFTTLIAAAAGGGGGGGGGGGATRKVINCVLGNASVYIRGIRIRMQMRKTCRANERIVVL